ncbi:biosynthetic-type acetolactate synthase large subunit [Clostridium sp. BJN0001]|uniref:biosynthetic-type acetolactate synthase large subunit n=1 Tax=Clostridium sp. BJN0001 TaxID=2930219 RepID=UPI001FD32E32|nr:biosynthetic-type acetolactate synthase large subunit [Clostridium sp. BJN0001]
MKFSGAEIVIKLLEMHNIKFISGIPGGFNLPLYDALYKSSITHILARSEQGAAFIAQGISRTSKIPGVCFATSGPGATNLITAIADAKLDSIPLIAITGQVPLSAIGTDAFQEVDTYGLTIPITKHNFLIRDISELIPAVNNAFKIAMEGRKGPVVIDIPKNIQTEIIDIDIKEFSKTYISENEQQVSAIENYTLNYIADLINNSKRPIIYAGGGIISSNSSKKLYEVSNKGNIPVSLSLMGLGAFPADNTLYLGMLGMHGAPYTNYLLFESDLIIALGVRFDDRATGNIKKFCPKASIIQVDIDPAEIDKVRKCNVSISCDVHEFLNNILPLIKKQKREDWILRINSYKKNYPLKKFESIFHPSNIISYVSENVPSNTVITTDVGQHQMWVAQRYLFKEPNTFLSSGGLGTMGFGLPAAIGAAIEDKNKKVICFSGDGSILMNIQELATLSELDLDVKVIIFNNHRLGLVHQQQDLFFKKHFIASSFIKNPDFETIGKGFFINSVTLNNEADPIKKLKEILKSKKPYLINIEIDENENIYPMVKPGSSNLNMIGCDIGD